jgi:tetratricopeptide (TPR) repeat protein
MTQRPALARVAPPLLVALASVAAFLPVLGNGFVNWDDGQHFLENEGYRGLAPQQLRWMFSSFQIGGHYQPLAWLSFGLDYLIWGLDPRGYHASSLLLHAVNALLVYALILRLLPAGGAGAGPCSATRWAAAAGALLFGVHPLRVEPIAWATDRGNLLATLLLLLAFHAYLTAVRAAPRSATARRGHRLALAAVAASLLARAWAVTFPLVLLVIDALVLERFRFGAGDRERRRLVLREKLPYAGVAAAGFLIALLAKSQSSSLLLSGAIPHGLRERLLQAGWGLAFYPGKTLAPFGLSPLHPLERQLLAPDPAILLGVAVSAGITGAAFALRRRFPALLAAWLCFALLVSPVLGLAQAGPQIAAERYSYLAGIPFAALAAAALLRAASALSAAGRRRLAAACALALLGLAALSARQCLVWRDSTALWRSALTAHPDSSLVAFYWGNTLREQGELAGAIAEYGRALALGVPLAPSVHNNRSVAHQARGELALALADMDAAIALAPSAAAYTNRGLLREPGDPAGAIADFSEAIRLAPDDPAALRLRGIARERAGDRAGARQDLLAALERAGPDWPERRDVRGRLRRLDSAGGTAMPRAASER